ncbi:MAG: hypothetical protein CVU09_09395 [Bacteroidetes bacterium HGW-Bacteroidetes-4]|jgi:hypothetical protein|nr:MAG: hypothetical protein CVU09_09395 [Bacteroidetes bacterium HGW-Bacteroidetes-4]
MPTININKLHINQLNLADNLTLNNHEIKRDCHGCRSVCPRYQEYINSLRNEIIKLKEELIILANGK